MKKYKEEGWVCYEGNGAVAHVLGKEICNKVRQFGPRGFCLG